MQAKVIPEINNLDIPSIYYDSILNDEQYIPSDKIPKLLSNQNNKTSFTALSLNVRSLNKVHNFLKLESFLQSINVQPSILAITETWLKENQTGPHTNLYNYTVHLFQIQGLKVEEEVLIYMLIVHLTLQ